jgi:hypothetical protein
MRQTKQSSCPAPSVLGDNGGTVTGNESFVTVNDDTATLPNSRQLTAGTNISVVDSGAGNPITINCTLSSYLDIQWLKADLFQGGEPAGYTPAPVEEIVLPAGNKLRAVKFISGTETAANCHFPFPDNVPGNPGISYLTRIYWLTDNTDVANSVNWRVGNRHYGAGDSLDTVAGTWSVNSQVSAGVNLLNTRTAAYAYNGPDPADAVLAMCNVKREVDSMPGTAWLIGVRISIGLPL